MQQVLIEKIIKCKGPLHLNLNDYLKTVTIIISSSHSHQEEGDLSFTSAVLSPPLSAIQLL